MSKISKTSLQGIRLADVYTFWWTHNLEPERCSVVCGVRRALLAALGNSLYPSGPQWLPLKWACWKRCFAVTLSSRHWCKGDGGGDVFWSLGPPASPESAQETGFMATPCICGRSAGHSGLCCCTQWIESFSGLGLNGFTDTFLEVRMALCSLGHAYNGVS